MNWQDVCGSYELKDLPFKIELNRQGQILMTPVKVSHSLFQGKISGLLYENIKHGEVLVECAIGTKSGTKVADVAWVSNDRLEVIRHEIECSVAPEICIEVMSPTNTEEEMVDKRRLYFESGAQEVWICDENGVFKFFNNTGKSSRSLLAPDFPRSLFDESSGVGVKLM